MTVEELIIELQSYNDDMEVEVFAPGVWKNSVKIDEVKCEISDEGTVFLEISNAYNGT